MRKRLGGSNCPSDDHLLLQFSLRTHFFESFDFEYSDPSFLSFKFKFKSMFAVLRLSLHHAVAFGMANWQMQ